MKKTLFPNVWWYLKCCNGFWSHMTSEWDFSISGFLWDKEGHDSFAWSHLVFLLHFFYTLKIKNQYELFKKETTWFHTWNGHHAEQNTWILWTILAPRKPLQHWERRKKSMFQSRFSRWNKFAFSIGGKWKMENFVCVYIPRKSNNSN